MDAPQKNFLSAVLILTAIAFGLRLAYAFLTHPFIDEFTTVFAAQMILEHGWPILPSGLFYEHGILFSYLATPFVMLAGSPPVFGVARLTSVIIGTALVPLLYQVGRRWFSPTVGLVAAALFVFSPEGIVWGGRVRMYALSQVLLLLLAFLAYEGRLPGGKSTGRWLSILILLALLLTQLAGLLFVPTLLIGLAAVNLLATKTGSILQRLNPFSFLEWIGFLSAIAIGIVVKRLGQPLGVASLGGGEVSNPVQALWYTIAYQTGVVLDYQSTLKFLARQFGVPHHWWLIIVALLGLAALIFNLVQQRGIKQGQFPLTFLWLVFGLVVLEMITVLQPFRRNPRYLVMGLPLFYLIVAGGLTQLERLIRSYTGLYARYLFSFFGIVFLILHSQALWTDLSIAFVTPEPAYDEAMQYIADHRQPGDVVLTMNPTPAALYLESLDFFAMQSDADQFLLNRETEPVDRWLGRPWIGTAAAFNELINSHARVWFVVDTIRLPVYYRGDWQALLNTQMDLVWAEDEALIYRTKPDRHPLPGSPKASLEANFDHQLHLIGFHANTVSSDDKTYNLTLFWQAITTIEYDYTVFIHIRDERGETVAQRDSLPVNGAYRTSQWHPDELIIDLHHIPLPSDFPAGEYQVWVGLYRLETLERVPIVAVAASRDHPVIDEAIFLEQLVVP